jgi:lipopolysaccharide transport system permease protein
LSVKIINNSPAGLKAYLTDVRKKIYLIKILVKREFSVKYTNTFLGLGWVFLQPLVVVSIYTLFFKNMLKLNTYNVPYPQFVLSGLVLWYLFTGIVGKCAHVFLESAELISKIAFPRIVLLLAKIVPVIVECFILLVITIVLTCILQREVHIKMIFCFFYFLQVLIVALAIGILVSVLALKFRDFIPAVPFILNFAIWLTPIFYAPNSIPEEYMSFFRYGNPLFIPLEGIRALLFNQSPFIGDSLVYVVIWSLFLIGAVHVFVKFDKRIVENI